MRFWLEPVLGAVNLGLSLAALGLSLPFLVMNASWLCRVGIAASVALFATSLHTNRFCGGHLDVLALAVLMVTLVECLLARGTTARGSTA